MRFNFSASLMYSPILKFDVDRADPFKDFGPSVNTIQGLS